jgi:hypothetical protein
MLGRLHLSDALCIGKGESYRKPTFISAPAGFGKTTLASEWVHTIGAAREPPLQVAWVPETGVVGTQSPKNLTGQQIAARFLRPHQTYD